MTEPDDRNISYQALLFANQVTMLTEAGFRDWLIRSFCGPDPTPELGCFHYEDDLILPDVFAQLVPEWPDEIREIAAKALCQAMEAFDTGQGTYEGLFTLVAIGEEFKTSLHIRELARVLCRWMDPQESDWIFPPDNQDDLLYFRETLECAYRLMMSSEKDFSDFEIIARWSEDILTKHHNKRQLIPAWAPMFFLAAVQNTINGKKNRIEFLESRLKSGDLANGDSYGDLYIYNDQSIGQGRFPYAIDQILEIKEQVVTSLQQSRELYDRQPLKGA